MTVERRLSEVLGEFARTLATDFPIQAILDHLVVQIVGVLPIDAAGVTLIAPGVDPRYVAASDAAALRFERLQTEMGEGPCIAAYRSGGPISIPDLTVETRFGAFTARALEAGLRAVFTFPLRHEDEQLGALDLYRTTAGPLDETAMAAAQTLADVAAAYLLNARARVELVESSARAQHLALHDALTGLPNRSLLVQRLEHATLRSRRSGSVVAVLFVDLDGFKQVNDHHGHRVGDEVLVAVAERLTHLLRPGDTVARLAGDEFAILCDDLGERQHVDHVADRISVALAEPFLLSDTRITISASIGIAFASDGDSPEDVLQAADTAMYSAKRSGGGHHERIDLTVTGPPVHLRPSLQEDLAAALERGQLFAEYQPIVSSADGRIVDVEALLRWAHPVLGTIGPDRIVPLAEHSGLIIDIGRWMLERACLDHTSWRADPSTPIGISVNVSARQLMAPGYAGTVADVLRTVGTDPGLLTLEVTESLFVRDTERAQQVLRDLKDLGVSIALDDFGTGYSSLSYLRQFPVDTVKIDRSFVSDLDGDPKSALIIDAVVGLAHGLRMSVVAEGVETIDQYHHVLALGCDAWQGYLFAQPMTSPALASLVEATPAFAPSVPHHGWWRRRALVG